MLDQDKLNLTLLLVAITPGTPQLAFNFDILINKKEHIIHWQCQTSHCENLTSRPAHAYFTQSATSDEFSLSKTKALQAHLIKHDTRAGLQPAPPL